MGNSNATEEEKPDPHVIPTEPFDELLGSIKQTEDISLSEALIALAWLRRTINNIIACPGDEMHQRVNTKASIFTKTFASFPDCFSLLLKIGFKPFGDKYKIDISPVEVLSNLKVFQEDIDKAIISLTDGIAFTYAYLPHMSIKKWEIQKELLSAKVTSLDQLDELLNGLGTSKNHANFFKAYYCDEYCESPDRKALKDEFFDVILPFIQKLALRIDELFDKKIRILPPGKDAKVVLTREQVACLLSHYFFCTFENPNIIHGGLGFNDCDFGMLFITDYASAPGKEKLFSNSAESIILCIMEYFRRIQKKMPTGNIIIHRKVCDKFVDWSTSEKPLLPIKVDDEMKIEDSPAKFHADFANQYIGGGALHGGCVQEEILFALKPECYISMLLCPKMEENEAIVISGAERFSQYSGYARSLKFEDSFEDKTPLNPTLGCLDNHIFCIDAIVNFGNMQFVKEKLLRDINKAYVGLSRKEEYHTGDDCIASTGNWGCGAFGGNLELKAIQQYIAASELGIPLMYHTFIKPEFAKALEGFGSFCVTNDINVKDVFESLLAYKPNEVQNEVFNDCIKFIAQKRGIKVPIYEPQVEEPPTKEAPASNECNTATEEQVQKEET